MFRHIHHRTWFPFVIAVLSLSLGLFIIWAYANSQFHPGVDFIEKPAVTMEQYQDQVRLIMKSFFEQLSSQEDEVSQLFFVSEVEQELLALRVPAEARSVHFEIVSSLELLRQGLVGNAEKLSQGQTRLRAVMVENSWLVQ